MKAKHLMVNKAVLQQGYTFVELAIVLVIIGILSSSIFIGRELIENARVNSMINEFETLKQAHYIYIKRTGHKPGMGRNPDGSARHDSWGGGLFDGTSYFNDLVAEGLISAPEPGEHFIKHPYGERWFTNDGRSLWHYASIDGPQICAYNVPVWVAERIDVKLDDGVPNTGSVMTLYKQNFFSSYTENIQINHFQYHVCRAL